MTVLAPWLWPVAAAPFVGSFAGVLALRALRPASIVFGRSACPDCGATLAARDLVPLFSWLWLRRRSRCCDRPISAFYPAIELAAIAIALWAATVAADPALWVSCGLGWTLLALTAADFRFYLLPDYLTLPLIAAGLLDAQLFAPNSLVDRAIGAAAGLMVILAIRFIYGRLRNREGIGLGDAKLLAAAGAWISWTGLPSAVLVAAVSALAYALARRGAGGLSAADRVPFGPFLCLGIWVVWLYGPVGTFAGAEP